MLVRDYHKSYYVPQNLCLVVAGKLKTNELLNVLQTKVEPWIIAHGQAHGPKPPGWKRPFVETPSARQPKLKGVKQDTVDFPEKDESSGEAILSFQGPPPDHFTDQKVRKYLPQFSIVYTRHRLWTCSECISRIRLYHRSRKNLLKLRNHFGMICPPALVSFD